MISNRQWQACLGRAKDGTTLRESVNEELRSQDRTVNGMGIHTLRIVRVDGLWSMTVNGSYRTGGYEGISELLDALARCPIDFADSVDPVGVGA